MNNQTGWIDRRMSAALDSVETTEFRFPQAVKDELTSLLASELLEPRKLAELDAIATRLGSANRGDS